MDWIDRCSFLLEHPVIAEAMGNRAQAVIAASYGYAELDAKVRAALLHRLADGLRVAASALRPGGLAGHAIAQGTGPDFKEPLVELSMAMTPTAQRRATRGTLPATVTRRSDLT